MVLRSRRGMRRWLRYQYIKLVRLDDTPEKIASGLALGVTLGILPTFGLGIIIAVFAAGLLKVNKVSAVLGTLVMNPWTATFFWAVSYITGSLVLGQNLSETLALIRTLKTHSDLWRNLLAQKLLLPYAIGNALVTAASAAMFYTGGLYVVKAYRRAKKTRRKRPKTPGNFPQGSPSGRV